MYIYTNPKPILLAATNEAERTVRANENMDVQVHFNHVPGQVPSRQLGSMMIFHNASCFKVLLSHIS